MQNYSQLQKRKKKKKSQLQSTWKRQTQEPKKENGKKNIQKNKDRKEKKKKMNIRKTQQAPAHGEAVKDERGKKHLWTPRSHAPRGSGGQRR